MPTSSQYLQLAGGMSISAAIAHLAVIIGGPDWYRLFGAGEELAQMAEQGQIYPAFLTVVIATILFTWGAYAFSAARTLPHLPLLRTALVLITAVYLIRGLIGLLVPVFNIQPAASEQSPAFWIISSSICAVIGIAHLLGLMKGWGEMSPRA